jgi:hypothetical protein
MEGVNLSQEPDTVRWCLEKSGVFTTSSLYHALTFLGVPNRWMIGIWTANIPLKIKIFLWQVSMTRYSHLNSKELGWTDEM